MESRHTTPATALEALLEHPKLWRARHDPRGADADRGGRVASRATGLAALDACLPGGGWPDAALVEILHDVAGIGELSLLLPVLARISDEGRLVVLVAPPHRPCVPALSAQGVAASRLLLVDAPAGREALWACEQALASSACGAALLWQGSSGLEGGRGAGHPNPFTALRRLQLAAEGGRSLGVIFRPLAAAAVSSPAPLRLALRVLRSGLEIELLKARGGRSARIVMAQPADEATVP